MNSKEIVGVSDKLIDFLSNRYPTLQIEAERYSWVTSIQLTTKAYSYLPEIRIKQENYVGEFTIGLIIGEMYEPIFKGDQSSDLDYLVNKFNDWFKDHTIARINNYDRISKDLKSALGIF